MKVVIWAKISLVLGLIIEIGICIWAEERVSVSVNNMTGINNSTMV